MSSDDSDFVAGQSEDEADHVVAAGTKGMTTRRRAAGARGANSGRKERWEDIQRSWDTVVEGEDGSIEATITGIREKGKRRR
jgi:transcription initiation factor TFIIH subunit 2